MYFMSFRFLNNIKASSLMLDISVNKLCGRSSISSVLALGPVGAGPDSVDSTRIPLG